MRFPKKIGKIKNTYMDENGLHFDLKLNKKWFKKMRKKYAKTK